MLIFYEVKTEGLKEWIQRNLKTHEKNLFGIGNYSYVDYIEEYQILSKDLFPIYKTEFINFYSQTNYLTILKDFNCTDKDICLIDSYMDSFSLYDSNGNGITYQIKKGTKIYIKQQGLKFNLNEIQLKNFSVKNGFTTLYMLKIPIR